MFLGQDSESVTLADASLNQARKLALFCTMAPREPDSRLPNAILE